MDKKIVKLLCCYLNLISLILAHHFFVMYSEKNYLMNSSKTNTLNFFRNIFKLQPLESILVYVTKGNYIDTFISKLPPNHYQYKPQTIRKVKRNEVKFVLDLSDVVDWYIYWGFKEKAKEYLFSQIKQGDTIVDIGANVGEISFISSKLVGDEGKVISYEPDHTNFKRFIKNIEINNFQNISYFNLGLGNQKGEFEIEILDPNNRGMNRIVPHTNFDLQVPFIKQLVQIETLDDHIESLKLSKVDLIKIDTEGFEFHILQGAQQVLKKYHPKLFIEIDEKNLILQGTHPSELIEMLHQNNYETNHAETHQKIHRDFNFRNCHFDLYAVPK